MCRGQGHTASKCSHQRQGGELAWYTSEDRRAIEIDDSPESAQTLCNACKKSNLLAWLREEPPIITGQDLCEQLKNPRLFRNLGKVGTIMFYAECSLCYCLFGLIANVSSLDQKVLLVLSWSMYRLEASVSMDSAGKRSTSRYITAFLDPSETGFSVEDLASTRGDGLCIMAQQPDGSPISLSVKKLDPDRIDLISVRRWLTDCDALHAHTCRPQVSPKLKLICLIDVKSRRLVNYPLLRTEYLALSYVWGNTRQSISGAGNPGTVLPKKLPLPRTIEDALALTEDLGQRYLWVDSVCIDQTNELRKLEQIEIMSEIYQGAYATSSHFLVHQPKLACQG